MSAYTLTDTNAALYVPGNNPQRKVSDLDVVTLELK